MEELDSNVAVFDNMFDFASEADRAKIRGLTAVALQALTIAGEPVEPVKLQAYHSSV
jgi:hypothetical protein